MAILLASTLNFISSGRLRAKIKTEISAKKIKTAKRKLFCQMAKAIINIAMMKLSQYQETSLG